VRLSRSGCGCGSEDALQFEDFFDSEFRRLAKAMFLVTGDGHTAEELAQEAMARTYERWGRVRNMANPAGYAYRIAFNLHRRGFRRRGRGGRADVGSDPQDPEVIVGSRSELAEAFAYLTVEQRQAVVLVEWLGYPAEEAGSILGIDAASVRGRLHRARETLRERLGVRDG
jgi:RNA polymerase sigma factor (sigma-70 family)